MSEHAPKSRGSTQAVTRSTPNRPPSKGAPSASASSITPTPAATTAAPPPPGSGGPPRLSLAALTLKQLSMLLCSSYPKPVSEQDIQRLIDEGAPTNPDGTIHFVIFLAWLVKRLRRFQRLRRFPRSPV